MIKSDRVPKCCLPGHCFVTAHGCPLLLNKYLHFHKLLDFIDLNPSTKLMALNCVFTLVAEGGWMIFSFSIVKVHFIFC